MYKTTWSVALLVCLAFLSLFCRANVSEIQFKKYNVENGLSQSTVIDIIEDKDGYIWLATGEGLNRFDGETFTQYFPRMTGGNKLPIEFIRKLFIDSSDTLWLTSLSGVAKYVPEKDAFQVYTSKDSNLASTSFWGLAELPSGELIVSGDDGLYQYNASKDNFDRFEFSNKQDIKGLVQTIIVDDDRMWLGTYTAGIYMADLNTNELFSLNEQNPWNIILGANNLFDIKIIDNQYWLGTEQGVIVLNADFSESKRLNTSPDSPLKVVSNIVRSIVTDGPDKIWIATTNGLSIYNKRTQTVFSVDQTNGIYTDLDSDAILKAFKDSNQSIWLGTFNSGLFQYHPQFAAIKHFKRIDTNNLLGTNNSVWAFSHNNDETVWISTQTGGISLFDVKNGSFKQFQNTKNSVIWDIEIDNFNRVWVSTDNGLNIYEYNDSELVKLHTFFSGMRIIEILPMGNEMWARDALNKQFAFNLDEDKLSYSEVDLGQLSNISALFVDSEGNRWLTSNFDLVVQMNNSNSFKQIELRNFVADVDPKVFNVHEVADGFWVSTGKHGLFKLDKRSLKIVKHVHPRGYDVRGVVLNSVLFGENQDSVWQSTQSEIFQISLESGEIIREIGRSTLDFNDLNQRAMLTTQDGKVLVGGASGFHIFEPAKLNSGRVSIFNTQNNTNIQLDQPELTELKILNKLVTINSEDSPLTLPIWLTQKIELSHRDVPFTLHFGNINSLSNDQINYRYRLLGWRDTWFETGFEERSASFTVETYGNHTFEVQGRIGEGDWSEPRTLGIFISPPFWLDKPAMAFYGLMAVIVLLLILRQYKRKLAIQNSIRESEERLKLTLWSSGDELWDWDVYRGQVYRANTWGTMDFPQDDIRSNSSYQANIHQNDVNRVKEALNKHIKKESEHFEVTYRARTFKGEWVWILDRGMIVKRDNNDQPLRMTGTLKNISHLKQAEEQLKLYERSIETISDGVFIADTNFKFISVNHSYCEHTGETREQGLASYLKFNQYPEAFTEEIKKSLRQRGNWNGEVESRRVNGERYEMELNVDAIQGEDGKTTHYVGVFSDITSRKSTEKELLKLANTDPLTDMPNRSFFQASHNNLVRKDVPHALICLDMDNFKKINDSLGHQTGDILIKQIGRRLQKIVGTYATCYRLGGDEFSILIDDEEQMSRINQYAQRVLDQMAHPFIINKQEFVLSASVGIAFYPEDGNSPQELLKNADTAMYFAKNAGGNKYQFFSGEMNQNAVRQLQIENLIRYGLKEDLFTVFYQPKVDIATGKLVSMEALVRFEHPEKGIVSPAQFIPLAEETGQIIEIGEQVLRKACEDTKRWVSQGLFTGRVAVNISARQFELPDLDDKISRILQKAGLSALHLECEITEGTLMQNPDQALQMMQRLREKGIHLALDDFGTGYSSLAYLKKFPINTLKIDKAFIDDIATSSVDKHMTAAIINIAHNLGLKVVAEGVEQERQLEILRRYDCEMLQGYLYSKPLSAAKFERLLTENLHISQLINAT
ncbi:EAL domain-containing protein [Aliiglaciecola sp.]|nr:EAL domain-containing protein [Aliiglaciecola sp.]